MRKYFYLAFVLLVTASCSKKSYSNAITIPKADTVLYSFVTIGCNRIDKGDLSPSNASTANLNQLNRTFNDILSLKNKPNFLFFVGDMVLGYTGTDTATLASELRNWVSIYENSGLKQAGVKLVPAPGNHETLLGKGLGASKEAEQVFVKIMQPYILNNNGPSIGGADNLTVDESQLTYSFNFKDSHFVVMNSDGVGKESRIPYRWVISDINTAKKNGAKHIFSFAHKPGFAFPGEDGLGVYPLELDSFWTALTANQSEAMFASHNHVYYKIQPFPKQTWQLIAGNGGSALSSYITNLSQRYYGFTLTEVFTNGKVIVKSYGRNVPSDGYLGFTDAYPTTIRDSVDISWGK